MSRLLRVVFAGSRKTGQVDLEAVEMLVRDSMHRAGAAALERLLSMPAPQPNDVSSPHYRAASISLSDEIHSFQTSLIVVSALVRALGQFDF